MKKGWVIAGVLALVLVLLGGLAAAWYWAGPWLAQEYIDWQNDGWDVVHVERYEEKGAVVFIVLIPERDFELEETVAILTTIGKAARILRLPGYDEIGILFVRELNGQYFMQIEIVAPMDKTEWVEAEDCQVAPLWFYGATLKRQYVTWPD